MIDKLRHHWNVATRREFFTLAGSGLAGIALADLFAGTLAPRLAWRKILWRQERPIIRPERSP